MAEADPCSGAKAGVRFLKYLKRKLRGSKAFLLLRSLLSHGFYHWNKKQMEKILYHPAWLSLPLQRSTENSRQPSWSWCPWWMTMTTIWLIMINWKTLKLVLERNFKVSCRMNFCLSGAGKFRRFYFTPSADSRVTMTMYFLFKTVCLYFFRLILEKLAHYDARSQSYLDPHFQNGYLDCFQKPWEIATLAMILIECANGESTVRGFS